MPAPRLLACAVVVLSALACEQVAPSDEPCDGDASCPDGEVCWRWFERGGDPPKECPRCAPPPVEGERCAYSDDQGDGCIMFAVACADGLECAVPEDGDVTSVGRCVVPSDVGGTCASDSPTRDGCADGLVCARAQDAVEGECIAP